MKLKLLGKGTIEVGNKEIQLSFKKAYALLFYLAIEGLSSRETIVNLLWGNQNEDLAKKNLRNTVYVIRKTLGENIVFSPKRDVLILDKKFIEYIDVLEIEKMTCEDIFNLNYLEFLQGFQIKDSEYFDEWVTNNRYYFSEKIKKRISLLVEISMENERYEEAELLCRKNLVIDLYDESTYRELFRALKEQNKYKVVISTYNELCDLLNTELMLIPDEETKNIFEEIMVEKSKKNIEKQKKFYGREHEIKVLKEGLNNYVNSNKKNNYLLYGEFGVGKSSIINYFYEEIADSYVVLVGHCYEAEKNFLLSPWFSILDEMAERVKKLENSHDCNCLETVEEILSNSKVVMDDYENPRIFNSYVFERTIIELVSCLWKNKLGILIFEDIQWMDSLSWKILIKLMEMNIFIIMTANTDYKPIEYYLDGISFHKDVCKLEILPFSKDETFEFIHTIKNKPNISLEIFGKIYEQSQGNPLYIGEIINNYDDFNEEMKYSRKINDVMQSRFRVLSRDEQKLLNISSNFYDYFNYEDIKLISGMDEFILLDVLNQLLKKNILHEVMKGNNIYFSFSHHAFRESVYNNLPISIKRVYHGKIGCYLEENCGDNPSLNILYRLIYNFSNSNNFIKELTYRIKFVSDYFNFAHEKFPVIGKQINEYNNYGDVIDLRGIHGELNRIELLYKEVFDDINDTESYRKLQFDYCKLIGRYYNISGELDKAIVYIELMGELAKKIGSENDELGALLQKIYYFINIRDIKAFNETLERAFILTEKMDNKGQVGILLRLKGYGFILDGKFEEGAYILEEAIKIFKSLENVEPYILNIVGAYYYMGEGCRFKGNFNGAMKYYNKAIELCKINGYSNKLAFIFGSMGQVYYEIGDYLTSGKYLNEAKILYDDVETAWGKVVTLGYYGLILMRNRKYDEVLRILTEIDSSKTIAYNPYDNALIQRIKAEICYFIRSGDMENELFNYLKCKKQSYCEIAIEKLEKFNSTYELKLLEKMNSLCSQCRTNLL